MTDKINIGQAAFIDGQSVLIRRDLTILEAAQKAGIYIPTLCHLPFLEPYGGCRLCAVEIENMKGFPTACTTPIKPGMVIKTHTPELQRLRREILEFTLSEHPYTCLVCKDNRECTDFMHSTRKAGTITGCNFCTSNGDCELQDLVDYLDLKEMKFPIRYRGIPTVKDNPFYDLDYNLCILCGRCVRICNEERNSHVLAFVQRGNSTIVGTAFEDSQKNAGCEYCGACVDVCPTGSISEKIGKWRGIPDRSVKTTCLICSVACEMNVNSRDGQLVHIGPLPGKRTSPPQLCLKGKFLPADLNHHPDRITTPLIKKEGRWIESDWKDAIAYIATSLEGQKGEHFGLIASAQDTLEDNYLLQKFSRVVMQSNNVDLQYSYPDNKVPELLHWYHAYHPLMDLNLLDEADALLILGLEGAVSHPMLENRIRKSFGKGNQIIYVSPRQTRTSTFTTHEILYEPGEEYKFVYELHKKVSGSQSKSSGSAALVDDEVTGILRSARKLVILVGDNLLRIQTSADILRLLLKLYKFKQKDQQCYLLFPGMEGAMYGNLFMGAHPDYLPGFHSLRDRKSVVKWNKVWNTALNAPAGWSRTQMIRQAGNKRLTSMMVIGDITPDPNVANLELLVQCNMFKTRLSEYAHVFLPLCDYLEIEGHTLSMDGKLRKVNKCLTKPGNVKSISGILSVLSAAMGLPGWRSTPSAIFREIQSVISLPTVPLTKVETDIPSPGKGIPAEMEEEPVIDASYHDHYHYRGNWLNALIPELNEIMESNNFSK